MKLLKLYSTNPNFKEIKFKPGLNVIAGLQSSALAKDSYNGIGKSTSLQLVHLMFGGSFNEKVASDKALRAFLKTYGRFYLEFSVGSVKHTIMKNFAENDFYLDDEKITKTAYPKKLSQTILFNQATTLKFKSLFNMFARRYLPERNYYAGALTQQGQQANDFRQILANLSLLGLDTTLALTNKKIADELSDLKKTEQLLSKQTISVNEADLLDLQDECEKLSKDKHNFIIAQNYDDLKRQADELTQSMTDLRNTIHANQRSIRKKAQILAASQDDVVDLARISDIYHEAKYHFAEQVTKQLGQAQDFHIKIQQARTLRLKSQIAQLREANQTLEAQLNQIEIKRDSILKDLNAKGALEEYNSIVERIRTIESNIAELTSYQTVLTQFQKDKARLALEKATIKAEAIKYLDDRKIYIKSVEAEFRRLVKRFYRDHGGALSITNTKDAQYLYDIQPHIHKDGSQGINEVKIFCYDMLLFILNHNLLGFVAHDSCIFSGVDPRQKAMMFKVVLELIEQYNLQYFVNINEDTYEQVTNEIDEGINILNNVEKDLIRQGTILKLFDADPKMTLFGCTFG